MSRRHYIFVYGTLKSNEPNHHVLLDKGYVDSNTAFVGNALTIEYYPMVIATRYNIPFVLDKPHNGHRIHGEVYLVTESTLSRLDELECHPHYYERRPVQVELLPRDPDTSSESDSDGQSHVVTCDMYLFHGFDPKLLELPFISNYSSTGSHGLEYVVSSKRVAEEVMAHKMEVKLPIPNPK
ncbi:gamma-glutamylaminecyclotransferase-like [Paramacrobiotus metropolitanus]|uniref:gamma-glutamylaminecyclotransferase-like n=1 Tax=Paramacrobiotus metropolitanus TaxID=2943436 RepID=UPI002445EDC1|nr:gamma-glutamylaminecyclotransferase-like [Paramacrobiotus metropolitanus]XP_055343755.1 gamma-glutamylaminecyclotransferase-like [Paramacrobiotus metropolitanus]